MPTTLAPASPPAAAPIKTPTLTVSPPTLMSAPELAYLREVGARIAAAGPAAGRIVELGCLLGGSTAALAGGLASSGLNPPPLLSYDSFVWTSWCDQYFPVGLRDGESFLELTRQNLGPLARHVDLRPCLFPEHLATGEARAIYPEAAPIGVVFVDCAKDWGVSRTLMEVFAPHLIPGRSLLIEQDFKHHWTFWRPLHLHAWRECFRPVHEIVEGWTIAFEYTGGWTPDLAERAPMPEDFTTPIQINAAWSGVYAYWRSQGHLPGTGERTALLMRLCHAMHLAFAGFIDDCLAVLEPWRGEFERLRRSGTLAQFHLAARDEYDWALAVIRTKLIDAVKAGRDKAPLEELWPVVSRLEKLRGGLFPACSLTVPI